MTPEQNDALVKRAAEDAEKLMESVQSTITKSGDSLPLLESQMKIVTRSYAGLFEGMYGCRSEWEIVQPQPQEPPSDEEPPER